MDATERKKYSTMENVLNKINQSHISLNDNDVKRNNILMHQVIEIIIKKVREQDSTFDKMFEKIFFGGSYYDSLKVGKPEEYDLDILLNLPITCEPQVKESGKDGFVYLSIKNIGNIKNEKNDYSSLPQLIDVNGYLSTNKVLAWCESLFTKALNEINKIKSESVFTVKMNNDDTILIYGNIIKQYPAFTLNLKGTYKEKNINLDIDLVPSFQFTYEQWPKGNYKQNTTPAKGKFLIVPKKPHHIEDEKTIDRYWRLSFQEQERELLKGHSYKALKPTIRLLKKLRDQQNHCKIASYFIKTIFLWEVDNRSVDFWSQPLSCVFITMLKLYAEKITNGEILYFWNRKFNLIGHLNPVTVKDIGNCLNNIIKDIENNLHDPCRVAKYLLSAEEVEILRGEVNLGKKYLKNVIPPPLPVLVQKENSIENNVPTTSSTPIECLKTDEILNMLFKIQNDNKKILSTLENMEKRISNVESKIDKLSKNENINNSFDGLLEFDKLNLTSNFNSHNI